MPPRTPLGAIDGNRQKRNDLAPFSRGKIQGMSQVGLGTREIARKTFLPPSTVQSTLERNPVRHQGESLPRSGRPPILSHRHRRLLLRIVRANPKLSYREIRNQSAVDVSDRTIRRILADGYLLLEDLATWHDLSAR